MKKISTFVLTLILTFLPEFRAEGQDTRNSFESFRKGILSGYSDFRSRILDHYEDFLKGTWHEYESLAAETRDPNPKPTSVPKISPNTTKTPQLTPTPKSAPTVKKPTDKPDKDRPSDLSGKDNSTGKDKSTGKEDSPINKPAPKAKPSEQPHPSYPTDEFSFYDLPVRFPKIDFNIAESLSSPNDFAAQWKRLADSKAKELLPAIQAMAEETGLNDYLVYELIKSFVNERFKNSDATSRMSLIHFLLANLGYDARIGVTRSGVPLLLMPFRQTIYGRSYMRMPEGKYYVFAPDGQDMASLMKEGIRTCELPKDAPRGDKFDLVLGELNIPVKPKAFDIKYGNLSLSGEVNENLMKILYKYPQMPISDYAESCPDPKLRKSLIEQVKAQLAGTESDAAVGKLLEFVQNAFEYATDDSYHGFEKPYFLEETLYYPKNDCEDRAIFYTYFLWNALGKEAQLVGFPGHEAATVRLDAPIDGTSYEFMGKTFYISDPTFIGSRTGMVMPNYRDISPTVDYTYQKKSR